MNFLPMVWKTKTWKMKTSSSAGFKSKSNMFRRKKANIVLKLHEI